MDVMDVEGFDGPAETSRAGGAWRLAVASGAMACFVVYAVYMAAFLIALRYGRRWLYSRSHLNRCHDSSRLESAVEGAPAVGVSVIKPVLGYDANLAVNLESFFKLTYPKYELLFCVAESSNAPSLPVIHSLMAKYPNVEVRIYQGGELIGLNPKINNMMTGYSAARHSLLWICDANILVKPYTLSEMVSHISNNPQIGLVHQLPFVNSSCGTTFADCLDKVYFGTQHARVYLLANWSGQNCANGMSWLLRREALEAVGGLAAFSDYLAEDFFIGKALWMKGWKLAMSTLPALQNPGVRSLSNYQSRIIRWGRLRATMMPWPGLVEPLTECFGLGVLGALSFSHLLGFPLLLFFLLHTGVWFGLDMMLLRTVMGQDGSVGPSLQMFLAWCLRELWTYPLFVAGVWSREVRWKGTRFKLSFGGKATKLD